MQARSKLLLAGLSATALLGIAVAIASANRLEFLWWERGFRIVQVLEFSALGFNGITCPVTLEGTFHSHSFTKVLESLIGYVTRASVAGPASCTGGTTIIPIETLPWHIRYNGFAEELPFISTLNVRLVGVTFLVAQAATKCLYQSTAASPFQGEFVLGNGTETRLRKPTELRFESLQNNIPLKIQVAGTCPTVSHVQNKNAGTIRHLNETGPLEIKLI
jgi:hypothetical protein